MNPSTHKDSLENLVLSRRGSAQAGCLGVIAAAVASPVFAYVGSYCGEGMGYVVGNIIDFIPLVKDVAPWLVERTGLIVGPVQDLNENFYQSTGAIGGFYGGLFFPWTILLNVASRSKL